MTKKQKQDGSATGIGGRSLALLWVLGLLGQLCWHLENQWFNTFVYAKIGPYAWIISWMTAISAAATTFSTFFFGTMSDRMGKRRPFVFWGYILWGIFTVLFGMQEFIPPNNLVAAAVMVVATDALMSFFGSMGNDAGFNSWTTDITDETNRGQLGAVMAVQPVLATIIGSVLSGILINLMGYFAFFTVMGTLVAVAGGIGAFFMREGKKNASPQNKQGFWKQFFSVFNFKTFVKNKELTWVFLIMTFYFICFNFYFVHVGNYFIYTLGFNEGTTGIIQGIGLGLAVLATVPAISFINRGKHAAIIAAGVFLTVAGLLVVSFCSAQIVFIGLGLMLVGAGYVLMLQTTTAWAKNLYPEDNRAQYEGVRIVFFVLIPMVVGPAIANLIIQRFGVPVVIDGNAGMAPSSTLFFAASLLTALTLFPTYMAQRCRRP